MSDDLNTRSFWPARTSPLVRTRTLLRLALPAALFVGPMFLTHLLAAPDMSSAAEKNKVQVAPMVTLKADPFPLRDVRLLAGAFEHAMDLDHTYLLSLEPDRLLHSFRLNAGLRSVAKPYGGWMAPDQFNIEFVGHYLSGCALMYASTGDARLKQKADEVVAGLAECQNKLGTGFVHAKPDTFSSRCEAPLGFWYAVHKVMAGLLEVYVRCDNPQALEVARKLADWAKNGADKFSDEQIQKMLGTEHGGINEALANLYALTGEKKYLELALRFNHQEVIGPASKRQDNLTWKHANTQIPKFIGTAREYELTGDARLRTASTFFWDTVVKERTYVMGGNSIGELFSPKETLSQAIGPNTCETCNTYNMLKLTRHLFCWEPRAEYADYYERALYNHILASQNPVNGMMSYYLPLAYAAKEYCTHEDSFWCCTGTGVENHAKYGDSIYFHQGQTDLWANLFIASELHWPAARVVLRQETSYPREGRTRFVYTCKEPIGLTFHIRHPYWAATGFDIRINEAKAPDDSRPGTYATVTRTWQSGDTVDVVMPFSLRTEGFHDNPRRVAVMYGPLVLCAQCEESTRGDDPFPAMIGPEDNLTASLEPVPGIPCTFRGSAKVLRPAPADDAGATLEPFYTMHGNRRYVVYWNVFTPAEWQTNQAQNLVDRVLPGNEQSERDHALRGANTQSDGSSWRHAPDGGWFSWDLKVLPGQPQELRVRYCGDDTGGREFDVLADERKLATVKLDKNQPGTFYEDTYALSVELTRGKSWLTIRFQAHPGKLAGGVFGCRILRDARMNHE
jgi:DUF1680 family protein